MTDPNKAGEQPAGEQIDYKAELEKLKAEYTSLQKNAEELKEEFLSEDYLNYLNAKSTGKGKEEEKKGEVPPSDDLDKMTPKQIYEKALKDAEAKIQSEVNKLRDQQTAEKEANVKLELKRFAESHADYETYRPIMYGLSLDPKFANASLQDLYNRAKEHVKELAGASEEEKKRSRASGGEKPGSSSSSVKKESKKLSADEAAEQAWAETVGADGLPPGF